MLAHLADMQVLLEFKQQVQLDPQGIMAGWTPSSDSSSDAYSGACSWHGVSCSPSQRVVKLELRDADLEGPLMLSTLLAMDMLELLDLSGNRFHGNLTSGVFNTPSGDCGNLQTVILGNNLIHGSIPSDLLACGTIMKLDLSRADLTGTLSPTFFLKCGSLKWLDLSQNHLTGRLPNAINSCAHLQNLNLSFNSLSGELPADILAASSSCKYTNDSSCMPSASLEVLDLTSNNLTGPIPDASSICRSCLPASLGALRSIRTLDLSSNHLSGSIPTELANACATLKHLQLSANNISGTIPSSLRACASLQTLSLDKNQLSGSFPGDVVSHLTGLEALALGFNHFTGPFPSQVTSCSNLKVLDLSSNKLTGIIPPHICSPSSTLETLLLANNQFGGGVPSSLANCSQLIVLDLSFNQLEGAIPQELGSISGLESLLLWSNKLIGEIPKELGVLSQLKSLVLNNNFLAGTIPLELSNCSAMEWICLSSNTLSGTIPTFLGAMQHLTILELGNNSLSGHVPPELANVTKFIWVDLNSNYLDGPIPSGLGQHPYGNVTRLHYEFAFIRNLGYKCRGLGILLEFGGITQAVLSSTPLRSACNLTRLYVEDSLNGDSDFSSIQYLDLSYNMLEGNIPEDMGYLTALQMLSLGHNQLVGPIPASFSHLKNIGVLDLSYNKLEGGVWPLANCSFLVQIDVSNNNLSGNIPTTGQLSTAPIAGFLNNSGLCGEPLPPCGSSSISSSDRCKHGACLAHERMGVLSWANSIVLGILIAVAFMCMLIVWGLMMRSKRAEKMKDASGLRLPASCRGLNSSTTWNIGGEKEPLSINVATFERPLRKLTFAQLIEATNGFSQESLIGVGGFGEVYKAELQDGSVVAIKKLLQSSYQGDREFIAEMETLGKIKHKNLVPLLGYCKVGEERLLVYEYMDGGSLEDMLHAGVEEGDRDQKLTWEKRKQIAKGAARGLAFLHHNCIPHIIHRDMKSSNVLLDKNLEARVSDFGMARLISALDTHLSVSTLAGTPGYVPPEYCQSFRCTTKGDVYSFGVVLLELLTGRRPTNLVLTPTTSSTAPPAYTDYIVGGQGELLADVNLVGWVRSQVAAKRALHALDARLLRASPADHLQMLQYLRLACDCVEDLPHRRPSMQHVLTMMKELEVAL
ncbi:hypothetical protein L7F22_036396 [Adiantum nelumboides]|nr:hypothetical protein [Adiantum nelumboides]